MGWTDIVAWPDHGGRGRKRTLMELDLAATSTASSLSKIAQAASAMNLRFLMTGPEVEWAEDKGDYIPWIDV